MRVPPSVSSARPERVVSSVRERSQVDARDAATRCEVRAPARRAPVGPSRRPAAARDDSASARCSRKASKRVVGPVQILEDEDGRAGWQRCSSRKRVQAAKFSSREASDASRPSRARSRWRSHARVRALGHDRVELRLDGGDVVGVADAGVRLDDLRQRPERDALAVGQAAALAPGDHLGARVDVRERTRARAGSCRCPGSPTRRTNCGVGLSGRRSSKMARRARAALPRGRRMGAPTRPVGAQAASRDRGRSRARPRPARPCPWRDGRAAPRSR